MVLAKLVLIFFLYLNDFSKSDEDYFKILDDFIAYRISYKLLDKGVSLNITNPTNWVTIISSDDEKYKCLLPDVELFTRKRIESYSGPTPAELLEPLYNDKLCSFRIESYWNYELCHGRYILQLHDEKQKNPDPTKEDQIIRTEYYLGNYVKAQAEVETQNFDQLNPPTRKFGKKEEVPYFPVTYSHGSTCDLTNTPRQTTVLYVCAQAFKHHIESFTETKSCQYEMVVLTNRLCNHPAFQNVPPKEHEIRCYATNKETFAKPNSLIKLEKESNSQIFNEYSAKNKKSNVVQQLFKTDKEIVDKQTVDEQTVDKPKVLAQEIIIPSTTILTKEGSTFIDKFWKAEKCLHTSLGSWSYHICHGIGVMQFKLINGKLHTNILLGAFDKEVNKAWIDENPSKARKVKDGKVIEMTLLYSMGTICPISGAARSCEVVYRCAEDRKNKIQNLYISISVIETEKCFYTIIIESHSLCAKMQLADKYGLFSDLPHLTVEAIELQKKKLETTDFSKFEKQDTLLQKKEIDDVIFYETNKKVKSEEKESTSENVLNVLFDESINLADLNFIIEDTKNYKDQKNEDNTKQKKEKVLDNKKKSTENVKIYYEHDEN